jgi:hypothetical protein
MQLNLNPNINSSTSGLRSNGQGNRDKKKKTRDVCYRCGERGHYKINCPLNKRPKNKGKEIAMTISEALVIESPSTSCNWANTECTWGITPTVMSWEKIGANSPLVILSLC